MEQIKRNNIGGASLSVVFSTSLSIPKFIRACSAFHKTISKRNKSMKQLKEIWKPIKDYEGLYELSNLGRIKSLIIEKILKPQLDGGGYLHIGLYKDNKVKTHKISHLVWDHFGNRKRKGSKIQVDHIKNNKLLNGIRDLQLLTARENVSKWYIQNGKKSSRFTGVHWNKTSKIWKVKITINKKENYLGRFNDEIEASDEYQRALKEFKETGKVTINTPAMKRKTSRYKGVHWNNKEKKWIAQIFINGKHIHFGAFINEDEAHLAYKNKLKNWR